MSNNPSKSTGLEGNNQRGSDSLIIYKATNLINNKVYIGQTINSLEYRKNQHIRETRSLQRKNVYFHDAISKYGANNFLFEEIDSAKTLDELDQKERYWINFYHSTDKNCGYNLDSGGRSGGVKSEETKKKIGITTREKWSNPEIAEKMMNGLKKGNETQKNKPRKVEKIFCVYCGKAVEVPAYNATKRKYCSNKCVADDNMWMQGIERAATINHHRNLDNKAIVKIDVVDWVVQNRELVLNCPKNKIRSILSELIEMTKIKYKIKDFRSLFTCFGNVRNMKEFLAELQNIALEENVC